MQPLPIKTINTKLFSIEKNVDFVQGKNILFVLHYKTTAIYIGRTISKESFGWKIEILTPLHKFRYSNPKWHIGKHFNPNP